MMDYPVVNTGPFGGGFAHELSRRPGRHTKYVHFNMAPTIHIGFNTARRETARMGSPSC